MSSQLLIATTNPDKLREVRAVLVELRLNLVFLEDFPPMPAPQETGEKLKDNARLKASYYARNTGMWTLADDSGLEVDALGGEPGVRSSRYAGEACDDAANNARLVQRLVGIPPQDRTARFRCAVALANPHGEIAATAAGAVEGVILDDPRGENGFGYDPHFLVSEDGRTAAEMPADVKNRLSHRGRALRAILPELHRLLRERHK